jgi:hypothetical protein
MSLSDFLALQNFDHGPGTRDHARFVGLAIGHHDNNSAIVNDSDVPPPQRVNFALTHSRVDRPKDQVRQPIGNRFRSS